MTVTVDLWHIHNSMRIWQKFLAVFENFGHERYLFFLNLRIICLHSSDSITRMKYLKVVYIRSNSLAIYWIAEDVREQHGRVLKGDVPTHTQNWQ